MAARVEIVLHLGREDLLPRVVGPLRRQEGALDEALGLVVEADLLVRDGQSSHERGNHAGETGRQPSVVRGHLVGRVGLVSGEDLVAAIAAEGDRHVLARQLGQIVGRDGGRIGEGLVEEIARAWARDRWRPVARRARGARSRSGARRAGHSGSSLKLWLSNPIEKVLMGSEDTVAHDRDDRARIEPAAQEHAERDVGDESVAHGLLQELGQALDAVRDGLGAPAGRLRRGSGRQYDSTVTCPRRAIRRWPGWSFFTAANIVRGARDVVVREVVVEAPGDRSRARDAIGEERFELGAEHQPIAQRRVVERLDAEPVAGEQQRRCAACPTARRRTSRAGRATQSGAVLLVEVDDDFGVGVGAKRWPRASRSARSSR